MVFAGISYIAVLVAAVAAFAAGSVYYGILGKPWMKAVGIAPEDAQMSPVLFAVGFLCEIVMAYMLAGIVGHLGDGQVTVANGIITAIFVWLGFVLMPMIVNHRYAGRGWDLTIIDSGHWLIVLIIMGIVIGLFGI